MKNTLKVLGLAALTMVPAAGFAMTESEMLALAESKNACGTGTIAGVRLDPAKANTILVTCNVAGGLEGTFDGNGALAAGAVAIVALAIASGGSSSSTSTTN